MKDLCQKGDIRRKIWLNLKNGWTEVENYDFTLSEIVLNKKYLFNWLHLLLEFSQGGGNCQQLLSAFEWLKGALFIFFGGGTSLKILQQEF